MLRNIKSLEGFELRARDGKLGHVLDCYFDDAHWIVRYLLVDTRGWLSGRRVLISPAAVQRPDWSQRLLPLELTKTQVRHSPEADSEQPVSHEEELALANYYNWPTYWAISDAGFADGALGMSGPPPLPPEAIEEMRRRRVAQSAVAEHHLRSVGEVTGYTIAASDGDFGQVEDFIFDDQGWEIRYLVIDTGHVLPGRKVLVAPEWIHAVGWDESKVSVDLTRDAIAASPPYDAGLPLTPDYTGQLHDHYGRPRYDTW